LSGDVGAGVYSRKRSAKRGGEANRGVEVRAGNRRESQDQGHERRARRNRVGKKRKRSVPAREPFGHDSGPDHCRYEKGRACKFGGEPPGERNRRSLRWIRHSRSLAARTSLPRERIVFVHRSNWCLAQMLHRYFVPIRSISLLIASLSRLARGKLRNRPILRSRVIKASRNALAISSREPLTAAGSGTPQ